MRSILSAALMLGVTGLFAGCAEDIPEIRIVANKPLSDDCLPSANQSSEFIARGVLDLFITDQYVIAPLVTNTMVPSETVQFVGGAAGAAGGLTGTRWEANTVTLTRAVAEFTGPENLGVPLPRSLNLTVTGSAAPGASVALTLQVVTANVANLLRSSALLANPGQSITILVKLKMFGVTTAGNEVDSNEFVYPIEVCNGCLLDYPAEAIDPAFPAPNCRVTDGFSSADSELPCFPGQDVTVDCRAICPLVLGNEDRDPDGLCSSF
ncbi:MAG: hypothetical protein KGO50_06870 [Myxococcales bacterium]|nr:hypothetical protein [Myxococcales bacterium]